LRQRGCVTVRVARAREQITGIVGGQIVPAIDTPLLTSSSTPWSGFLLETHAACGRQDTCWGWHRTHVSLFTKGQLSFRVHNPRGDREFTARAGSVCVFPSGSDETLFSIAGADFEAIVLELDPARVEELVGHKSPVATGALAPQIVVPDPHIARLLRSMASEVAQGCPAGSLYGQSLSLALASYLAFRFSVRRRKSRNPLRLFADSETRRVAEYIQANLDGELSLLDPAKLVQLSPRQFLRTFSNTFGMTPHRYIVNERVAQAKELIAKGRLLVDIAAKLGFANQSHFTGVFRKVTGMSPGRFRQETLDWTRRTPPWAA
jgi:AraC family transcriptional regulator